MPLIVLNGAKLIYHKREFCQMYYSSCSRKRYQLGQSCSKICFKIAPTYPVSICLCCGYVFTNVVSLYFLLLFLCLWVRRLHNSGLYIMCVIASEHRFWSFWLSTSLLCLGDISEHENKGINQI